MRPPRSLAIALLCFPFLAALWPADTTWVNDEPRLFAMALEAIRTGVFPAHGIMGSKGLQYGPFPLWFYTALLRVCPDLVWIAAIRAALAAAAISVSVWWLASTVKQLNPGAGALVLFSPYLWIMNRPLWDNTFLIPLSALTVAAYVSFCARPRAGPIWITVLGLALMFLTHPMSVAVSLPIVVHFGWFHRRWAAREWRTLGWPVGVALLLSWRYSLFFLHGVAAAAGQGDGSRWLGLLAPLSAGRFFSAWGLESFLGPRWWESPVMPGAAWIRFAGIVTWIAIPAAVAGAIIAGRRLAGRLRRGLRPDAADHLAMIALGTAASHAILGALTRTSGQPHYQNAVWFCYFFFLWTAVSAPIRPGPWRIAAAGVKLVYTAGLAAVLGFVVWTMHASGGNQSPAWGPSLRSQLEVVHRLDEFRPGSRVSTNVPNYVLFPHALAVLRAIHGTGGDPEGPLADLVVTPASPDPGIGRLAVRVSRRR